MVRMWGIGSVLWCGWWIYLASVPGENPVSMVLAGVIPAILARGLLNVLFWIVDRLNKD